MMAIRTEAQELGLHFMDNVIQSGYTNPGKMSKYRINVSLPSFYGGFTHTGPTIDDILFYRADGSPYIDVDAGLLELQDDNFLRTQLNIETFNVTLRFGKLQAGLSHAIKNDFVLAYPRNLAEMAFNGNEQFIDQTVNVAPGLNFTVYSEFGLHAAYQLTDRLSIGGRLKLLSGVGNISTNLDREKLDIYTDPEYYQLTATTDYQINAGTGLVEIDYYNDGDSTSFNIDPFGGSLSAGDFFSGNGGIGIDIGAEYQLNDKITLGASIIDLGNIRWGKSAVNLTSNGSYTFEGIDANDAFFGEDSIEFNEALDTLATIFGFEETNKKYSTGLPTKFYLSGRYNVTKTFNVGLVGYGEIIRRKLRPAIALSAQKDFGRIFSIGGVYAIQNGRFDNLGVNFGLKLGPIQLYGVSDNVISVFNPSDTKNVNFRMGLNIAIAKKKDKSVE